MWINNYENKYTSVTLEGMVTAREYVKDSYNEFVDVMAMLGKSFYICNNKEFSWSKFW